jgi:Conserved hypothetical protein 2217 (DUF2460)
MGDFPILKTGAVVQDGSATSVRFGTHIVRFADGAEQRFRERKGPRRRWMIRLELLTDEEAAALAGFLDARQGRHGSFAFFDPWDGVEYSNCSLESDSHEFDLREHARAAVTVWVRQNWS